jgi:methyl-accepting chemotaxis protein
MTSWFKGLKAKLLLLVVIPIALIAGLTTYSYTIEKRLGQEIEQANRTRLPLASFSGEMQTNINASLRFFWTAFGATDAKARAEFLARGTKALEAYDTAAKGYEALPRSEWAIAIYKDIKPKWQIGESSLREAYKLLEAGTKEGDEKARELVVTSVRPNFNLVEAGLNDLDTKRLEAAKESTLKAEKEAEASILYMVCAAIFGSAIVGAFGAYTAQRLAQALTESADGIAKSVHQFSSASSQLSSASQTLSAGSSQAASSLEETVASLEELSSMVARNAENSKEAGSLSVSARSSAEEGENEVKTLVSAMQEIAQSSKKIEEIINVIDDIAFQTNLLALNAAVEAARAGEQGKGFAVVAEAVRNLAQRSGEAAKDINGLIKESVERVERGGEIAERSGTMLRTIVSNVKKVADLNHEIASASQEQATGLSQISKAMNQLDQATQSNAASAEETASAGEELSAEAASLKDIVARLTFVIEGESRALVSGGPVATSAKKAAYSQNVTPSGKVLAFSRPSEQPKSMKAAEAIPFEEEAPRKVGNLNGF